jgi:hypothetical protein
MVDSKVVTEQVTVMKSVTEDSKVVTEDMKEDSAVILVVIKVTSKNHMVVHMEEILEVVMENGKNAI